MILNKGRGKNVKFRPFVFTEHGCLQAANVLKSERAVKVSIAVIEAFVRLRQWAVTHAELARKLAELEKQYDEKFHTVFEAMRVIMQPPLKESKRVRGFVEGAE